MDEPLTGLDKNTKKINMINDLPRSKTIIIITHKVKKYCLDKFMI